MNPFPSRWTTCKPIPDFFSAGWVMLDGGTRWDVPSPSLCIISLDGGEMCGGWGLGLRHSSAPTAASPLCRPACQPSLNRSVRDSASLISLTFLRRALARVITLLNDIEQFVDLLLGVSSYMFSSF